MRAPAEQRRRLGIAAWLVAGVSSFVGCATPQQRAFVLGIFFDRSPARAPRAEVVADRGSGVAATSVAPPTWHAPYAQRQCNRCHGAGLGGGEKGGDMLGFMNVDPTSFKTAREQCLSCHANPKEVSARSVVAHEGEWLHGPVANGECCSCHCPHESRNRALLITERSEPLCLQCHKDQRRTTAMSKLDCTDCHDPHKGKSADAYFLKRTRPASSVQNVTPERKVPRRGFTAPPPTGSARSATLRTRATRRPSAGRFATSASHVMRRTRSSRGPSTRTSGPSATNATTLTRRARPRPILSEGAELELVEATDPTPPVVPCWARSAKDRRGRSPS